MKSILVTLRLKPNEFDWLVTLSSSHHGHSYSDCLRTLLFQEADRKHILSKTDKWGATQSEFRQGRPNKNTPGAKIHRNPKTKTEQFPLPL